MRAALTHLRTLLEHIAGASLTPVFDAGRVLGNDAGTTRRYASGGPTWTVTEPACKARARELRESGRVFYREKYRRHFDNIVDPTARWFKSMAEDPLNKTLTRDLLFDSEGNLQSKKTLWEDVRGVILPTLVDKVSYIPIPRVEYTDDALDLVVENQTLSERHLFPNIVELEAHDFVRFSPYEAQSKGDKHRHEATFTFAQMHADMRDVAFEFRTKSGPIKMRDLGLADVLLGGQGLIINYGAFRRLWVLLLFCLTYTGDAHLIRRHAFCLPRGAPSATRSTICCTRPSSSFKPLATRLIKKQIKKALEDAIRTGFDLWACGIGSLSLLRAVPEGTRVARGAGVGEGRRGRGGRGGLPPRAAQEALLPRYFAHVHPSLATDAGELPVHAISCFMRRTGSLTSSANSYGPSMRCSPRAVATRSWWCSMGCSKSGSLRFPPIPPAVHAGGEVATSIVGPSLPSFQSPSYHKIMHNVDIAAAGFGSFNYEFYLLWIVTSGSTLFLPGLRALLYRLLVVHIAGASRSTETDEASACAIEGTVRMVGDGAVRWSMTSSEAAGAGPEWVTERVQVGDIGSAIDIIGL
ncbi:hypothetical protein B0H11DRAFT_2349001 [Mycena galericulata]|nr:hypothetical protein B0H11DRAFT_2349001 [Mycena galericulata]